MATAGGCVEVRGALALLVNVDQRKFKNEVSKCECVCVRESE